MEPTLDTNKWTLGMYWWQGRQPAWFNPRNVEVKNGQLHLTMRQETVPAEMKTKGYHDYTSAALHTKARSSYGYYEVKARPMNSGGSSSFWFQQEDPKVFPGWATEVDVFELCGKSAMHDRRYYMTLHVSATPDEKRHWQVGKLLGSTPSLRRRVSCFRLRLGSRRTALVRRWRAGAHGSEHPLASPAPSDLRQRNNARVVRDAE